MFCRASLVRKDVRTTLLVGGILRGEISESAQVKVLNESLPDGSGRRFWYEQRHLPIMIRNSGADVLLSTGNFALYRSPVPQILLSRNALYTSADFHSRRQATWRLSSVDGYGNKRRAGSMVGESSRLYSRSQRHLRRRIASMDREEVMSIHHGFDHEAFFRERAPLGQDVQRRLAAAEGAVRVLFVSHYNYYRNFETLIRAIAIVKKMLRPRDVRLILTCKLSSKDNPGIYQADRAADLVRQLNLREEVVELGAVPYAALHHLYKTCDLYVTPAYAETFAHPLVEAMASGLPVIASDLAVHREICGDAAQYFPRFWQRFWRSVFHATRPRKERRCVKRELCGPRISAGTSMWRSCFRWPVVWWRSEFMRAWLRTLREIPVTR